LKKNKYKKIKNKKGIKEIVIFSRCVVEINFIVVSENIIKIKPVENVIVFNLE